MLFAIIGVSAVDDTLLLEMCVITITIQIFLQVMTLDEGEEDDGREVKEKRRPSSNPPHSLIAAWGAVKGSTLLTIASSFSLGTAITECGLSDILANGINKIADPFGKIGLIAVVYFFTSFLSILVSNTAVVVFLFNPVAKAATGAGMDLKPFVFVLMIASSAAYATPISYQTNLMVLGPGGYQFNDYLKFGGPLQVVSWVSTTIAVYAIWGSQ
jgi:di/tricarboxylate transporter